MNSKLMETANLSVSVIVCTYNQSGTIGRTLDSILGQKVDFKYEIILGEDASPLDDTRKICEEYAKKYPDIIHLMPKAENKGLLVNYMDCLAKCSGIYIAPCSGDDFWHNDNKLQYQFNFLNENPQYGLVYTDFRRLMVSSGSLEPEFYGSQKITPPSGKLYNYLIKKNPVAACTVMYSRILVEKYVDLNEYYLANFGMEDYPMWLELSQHTLFKYLPICTLTYSVAEDSLSNSSRNFVKMRNFEESILSIRTHFLKKYPIEHLAEEDLIDLHNREMVAKAIISDNLKEAKIYAYKLNKSKITNLLKIFICITPLVHLYRKRLLKL